MYRRIRLICCVIELKARGLVDNPAHIIGFALIVENYSPLVSALRYREYWYTRWALKWKVGSKPNIGVIQSSGNYPDPDNERYSNIDNSPIRNKQWRAYVGNLTPCWIQWTEVYIKTSQLHSQSNVIGNKPIPLVMPKTWLTTRFDGLIQQGKVK